MKRFFPALALTALATAAMAHGGVTNPMVMARMDAMSTIAAEVKALTQMARGEVGFDAAEVTRRMEAIAATGAQVPLLFEAAETDPKSEASPTIWTSYPEFTQRATAMIEAAEAGAGATDEFALDEALGALGQTCKSCHGSFKIEL
jgi:cytochrome c556